MQNTIQTTKPCQTCRRVRDPRNCENKLCKEWQTWFIDRWDTMRRMVMEQAHGKGVQGKPISVGGTKYHHPDHVRDFIEIDPCLQCAWRDGLCQNACETKQTWLASREESNELESRSQG